VSIIFGTAHEAIAIASRHDTWSLRAEGSRTRVSASAQTRRNVVAARRFQDAFSKGFRRLSGRIGVGQPLVDACPRIAEARRGLCVRAGGKTRASGSDWGKDRRIFRQRGRGREHDGRLSTATRNDQK
jgi:hypothetical protein